MSETVGSNRSTKIALLVIVVVIFAGVGVWLLSSGNTGELSANEKIEIPANGVQVSVSGAPLANITVHNVGSVPVTIKTIYVNNAPYSYIATSNYPNTFWAASKPTCHRDLTGCTLTGTLEPTYIAPGESVTFTLQAANQFQKGNLTFKVVTANGAEATIQITY
jgi:archaellum component FlaF (FlaF/FlaG flagellin family)